MRTNYFVLFATLFLFSTSCRVGFELEDLQPGTPNNNKLPRLDYSIDALSFQKAFPITYTPSSEPDEGYFDEEVYYTATSDVKFNDTKILGERMILDNVCNRKGPSYGTATCRIIALNTRYKGVFFTVLSFATISVSNLIGLPFNKMETLSELEFELFDSRGESLGIYRGRGRSKMWVGYYYGTRDAGRVTSIEAVRESLEEIQTQIYRDYGYLQNELLSAGPKGSY
jgi:hypothetical protein